MLAAVLGLCLGGSDALANVYASTAQVCFDKGYTRAVLQTAGPYQGLWRCFACVAAGGDVTDNRWGSLFDAATLTQLSAFLETSQAFDTASVVVEGRNYNLVHDTFNCLVGDIAYIYQGNLLSGIFSQDSMPTSRCTCQLGINGSSVPSGGHYKYYSGVITDNGALAVDPQRPVQSGLALNVIYPNPLRLGHASTEATIAYSVTEPGAVVLDIVDVSGRPVATLLDGMQTSGAHLARWTGALDGGGMAFPGVYFARLRGSRGVVSHRIVVAR